MPQLDILAYTSEVMWLIVVFGSLYFLILRLGLPKLYKILLYRQEKIFEVNTGVKNLEEEFALFNGSLKELVVFNFNILKVLSNGLIKWMDISLEEDLENKKNRSVILRNLSSLNKPNLTSKLNVGIQKTDHLFVKAELLAKIID